MITMTYLDFGLNCIAFLSLGMTTMQSIQLFFSR